MDADCLIKLAKAGLKELVVNYDTIIIPEVVKREVIDAGKQKRYADAAWLREMSPRNGYKLRRKFHLTGQEMRLL